MERPEVASKDRTDHERRLDASSLTRRRGRIGGKEFSHGAAKNRGIPINEGKVCGAIEEGEDNQVRKKGFLRVRIASNKPTEKQQQIIPEGERSA